MRIAGVRDRRANEDGGKRTRQERPGYAGRLQTHRSIRRANFASCNVAAGIVLRPEVMSVTALAVWLRQHALRRILGVRARPGKDLQHRSARDAVRGERFRQPAQVARKSPPTV